MNNDEVAGRHGVAELAEQLEEVEIMDEENEDEGKDGDTDKEEGREDQDPYGTYSYNELGANGEVVAVVTVSPPLGRNRPSLAELMRAATSKPREK